VHVVPIGIDAASVKALALEPPEIEPSDVPRVVGLGRLSEEKGFDLLVRAHANVRAAGVVHELCLIGEGSARGALRALADELGVGESVRLTGFVENPFPTVASASAFVLPSRREGLPLVLLQALALGVPVIASRCSPGVESALEHGLLGVLVEPESVPALAEAIRRHLDAPGPLGERAARAARDTDRYDVARAAPALVDVLRPLSANHARARVVTAPPAPTND
jgi:glycosyltransferase involved in cell wall biosynthesis